jgi:hypothetical protein
MSVKCFLISSDLQMVNIGLRVLSRPDQMFLPSLYRQLGTDYDERVLPSIVNEVSMSAVLIRKYKVFELPGLLT